MQERLYGYGIGIVAGLTSVGAFVAPQLTGWLVLLVVLVWAARRRVGADAPVSEAEIGERHTNEYGEVWRE